MATGAEDRRWFLWLDVMVVLVTRIIISRCRYHEWQDESENNNQNDENDCGLCHQHWSTSGLSSKTPNQYLENKGYSW